jgi:hypothetical protein
MTRQTIVRNCSKISRAELHDNLMVGWQRCIARYGKGPFAEELDVTTAALDKHIGGSMPGFDSIVDAFGIDGDVLNEVCDRLGVRIVSKEASADLDDLNLLLARALVIINGATHPESPGGRAIVHSEYLEGEDVMRAINKASGDWLERCASIRKPRMVK